MTDHELTRVAVLTYARDGRIHVASRTHSRSGREGIVAVIPTATDPEHASDVLHALATAVERAPGILTKGESA